MTSISGLGNLADALQKLQESFKKADTDKNGTLSEAEFTSGLGEVAGTDTKTLFKQMDKDGDGQLSTDEMADGAKLADKVHQALLMAQELMSGATLMNMIGGKSSGSTGTDAASFFSDGTSDASGLASLTGTDGTGDAEDTSTDAYTTMLEQIVAKYQDAEKEAAAADKTTTTTEA